MYTCFHKINKLIMASVFIVYKHMNMHASLYKQCTKKLTQFVFQVLVTFITKILIKLKGIETNNLLSRQFSL